jgi:hypothetical protein
MNHNEPSYILTHTCILISKLSIFGPIINHHFPVPGSGAASTPGHGGNEWQRKSNGKLDNATGMPLEHENTFFHVPMGHEVQCSILLVSLFSLVL